MIAEGFAVLPPEIVAAAGRGWHILPVQVRGKLPLVKGWPEDATATLHSSRRGSTSIGERAPEIDRSL